MRILRHDNDPYPCGNMKSARPQILLQEDVVQNGVPAAAAASAGGGGPAAAVPDTTDDDDIAEYARALGINAKNEEDLLWIARDGLNAALPPDWRALEDQPSGQIYYFNVENGQAAWEHPMDGHYRQVVEQERQKRLRKTCAEEPFVAADGSPGRPKSPYAVFRQPSPTNPLGPRFERPSLRPRGFHPNSNSRSPTGNLATPPPWAKTTVGGQPLSPQRTPSASPSPGESRRSNPSIDSDGLIMKSPDTSSVPFNRTSSPNATSAEHTLIDGLQKPSSSSSGAGAGGALPNARASGSFHADEKPPLDRKLSNSKQGAAITVPPAVEPVVPLAVQPLDPEKLKQEEMRIKKENELALEKIRAQLAKEKLEEEQKIRSKMADELRMMKEKLAKERELSEKDLRQKAADELKKVRDLLQKERESQERSVREAVQNDLKKLKDQLEVERMTQERALRSALDEKLKETQQQEAAKKDQQEKDALNQQKELGELRRSMEAEIAELQATHKRRVEDLRKSHEAELEEIERNLAKLRRELEKLEMQVADESAIKKTQIEALERQKASLEKHLSDLRKQELEIRTQCDNLTDELKQLTKDSKLNERVMVRLEQQRTDMEEDLYMLKRAKQRYVDRVEQLKSVVGETLFNLPSDTEETPKNLQRPRTLPTEGADANAGETADVAGTPTIEVETPPPLENGLGPSAGERSHFDSDDLLSNPSRPLTPEPGNPNGSSRPVSPGSFFRRHTSLRPGDQSPGTNGYLTSTNYLPPNLRGLASVFRDLLTDEAVCSDVVLPALVSSLSMFVKSANTPTVAAASTQAASRQPHDDDHSLTSVHYHPGSNHHLSLSARDSAPSVRRAVRAVSCQSPVFGHEKIDNKTRLLNDFQGDYSFSDPGSYLLKAQLEVIKDWMARNNAQNGSEDSDLGINRDTEDDSPNGGYRWIPDSSDASLNDIFFRRNVP